MILQLGGVFTWEVWDHGRLVLSDEIRNGITTVGITDMFEQYLRTGTGLTFYIGLIDNTSFSAVDPADTMASHAGWTELTTYDEATRPAWSPDAAASARITNSTKASFTVNAASNARGIFLASDDTKSGTTGILWCTAVRDLATELAAGQDAKAGYTLTGVGA